MNNFSIKTLRYSLILIMLVSGILSPGGQGSLQAQLTPGLIVEPANATGKIYLDPDGDGYVSQKTNGVQLGFTNPPNNDVTQSEIPYVAIIKPDLRGDLLRGPTGSFSEIIGVDEAGNNAILGYNDGTNWLFRFRIDGYSTNTITYCILIDTDGKFGFTGENADPNAVSGNPGFEIEITLTTNFHVRVWNVDGVTSGALEYCPSSTSTKNIATHHQKAIAVTNGGGNPDYFYDFYVPFS
jgi:large repetitive protein